MKMPLAPATIYSGQESKLQFLMSARPIPPPHSRVDSYRELAMQAINCVAGYRLQAERFAALGDTQIADEYQQLATEAVARAERYLILADFAEKNP